MEFKRAQSLSAARKRLRIGLAQADHVYLEVPAHLTTRALRQALRGELADARAHGNLAAHTIWVRRGEKLHRWSASILLEGVRAKKRFIREFREPH